MALNPADMAVFTKIKLAAHTLRALPHDVRNWPAGVRSVWPDMNRQMSVIHGGTRKNTASRPSASAIDRMDCVLETLSLLTLDHRRLVWARANRVRWAVLAQMTGRSRTSLNRDFQRALAAFAAGERRLKKIS